MIVLFRDRNQIKKLIRNRRKVSIDSENVRKPRYLDGPLIQIMLPKELKLLQDNSSSLSMAQKIDVFPDNLAKKLIETEKKLGLFVYDKDVEIKTGFSETSMFGIYKLNSGAIYKG